MAAVLGHRPDIMTLWQKIRATLVLIGITLNTLVLCIPLFVLALLKLILPVTVIRVGLSKILVWIAETWIAINSGLISLISRPHWHIEGLEGLSKDNWYLVTSNHQSWADILVLQAVFNRRIPFLKFFLKQELIKVPILGLAWWALDFPFMKRYSKAEIERHPELKGKDLETTRKACEKFAYFPTSVMNFFEGTRFTRAKHDQQGSPYQYLLKPRAGGAAFTLNAMGGKLDTLLDITILYPDHAGTSLFAFLGGAVPEVRVIIHKRDIPTWASQGDYENDADFRLQFQNWVSEIWQNKDKLLERQRVSENR